MKQENTEQSDAESLNPERDAIWAKHYKLTPALCEEMLEFAGKMEQERNIWKHEAKVAADEVNRLRGVALDAIRALMFIHQHAQWCEECKSFEMAQDFLNQSHGTTCVWTARTNHTQPNQEDK